MLIKIGEIIINNFRDADFPARYTGQALVIICLEKDIDCACQWAEKLPAKVQRCFLKCGPSITVSIGISCIRHPHVVTASQLISLADKAMYEVKRTGKNSVGEMPDLLK